MVRKDYTFLRIFVSLDYRGTMLSGNNNYITHIETKNKNKRNLWRDWCNPLGSSNSEPVESLWPKKDRWFQCGLSLLFHPSVTSAKWHFYLQFCTSGFLYFKLKVCHIHLENKFLKSQWMKRNLKLFLSHFCFRNLVWLLVLIVICSRCSRVLAKSQMPKGWKVVNCKELWVARMHTERAKISKKQFRPQPCSFCTNSSFVLNSLLISFYYCRGTCVEMPHWRYWNWLLQLTFHRKYVFFGFYNSHNA